MKRKSLFKNFKINTKKETLFLSSGLGKTSNISITYKNKYYNLTNNLVKLIQKEIFEQKFL